MVGKEIDKEKADLCWTFSRDTADLSSVSCCDGSENSGSMRADGEARREGGRGGSAQEGEGGLAGRVATAGLLGLLPKGDAADEEAAPRRILRQLVLGNRAHVVAGSLPYTTTPPANSRQFSASLEEAQGERGSTRRAMQGTDIETHVNGTGVGSRMTLWGGGEDRIGGGWGQRESAPARSTLPLAV